MGVRSRRRLGLVYSTATVVLVVLLVLRPLPASRAIAVWLVLVTALSLSRLARRARPEPESVEAEARFEAALRPRARVPELPAELDRLERELVLGADSAAFAHRRLLPRLRAVAEARLSARHGVELERRPEDAEELLGADGWELVRPDRPVPEDWNAPGIPLRRVAALIDRLEAL